MYQPLAGNLGALSRMPAELARQDLTPRGVTVLSFLGLALVTLLDALDGTVGAPFAVAFVLISATAPLATQQRGLVFTTVQPTLLLVVILLLTAAFAPTVIEVPNLPDSANTLGRAIAAGLQRGEVLFVAQAFAIVSVLLRIWSLKDRPSLLS